MLNDLSSVIKSSNVDVDVSNDVWTSYPLPEDSSLQSFSPLEDAFKKFNFKLVCEPAKAFIVDKLR